VVIVGMVVMGVTVPMSVVMAVTVVGCLRIARHLTAP
jgi:hypothetical protein